MCKCVREFEALGVRVLSPKVSQIVNPSEEFAILESDDTDDPRILEERHLEQIEKARALYIWNPGGYIGLSVAMEIGWAHGRRALVFARFMPVDAMLRHFVAEIATPRQAKKIITI
ncbi:MAG: hypothetical protein AAB533_01965 [Patescibacteria group bacterium]